ncbi:hypothetical protein F5879DRAFT_37403 [Lentinula edodes]|nr:hypothetical protein F5879DRAFT_37403 [Lentinula edodes]
MLTLLKASKNPEFVLITLVAGSLTASLSSPLKVALNTARRIRYENEQMTRGNSFTSLLVKIIEEFTQEKHGGGA